MKQTLFENKSADRDVAESTELLRRLEVALAHLRRRSVAEGADHSYGARAQAMRALEELILEQAPPRAPSTESVP